MKSMIMMLAVLSMMANAMAEDAKEPKKEAAELTTARNEYKAAAESALAPVKAKYVAKLTDLMKRLGGQGKIDEAAQVKAELDKVNKAEMDKVQLNAPSGNKSKAVGKWSWSWGATIELAESGQATLTCAGGEIQELTWTEKDGKVTLTWTENGRVETFKYNPAGTKAVLTESNGAQSNINKMK